MSNYTQIGGLQVDSGLKTLIDEQICPGTGVDADAFWSGLESIIKTFAPRNRALLAKREDLQAKINDWHLQRKGQPHDAAAYKAFLQEIGYLLPEP